MKYANAKVVDGKIVEYDIKEIDQSKLTSDCWLIQFNGLSECETCSLKGKPDCGGGETLKKLKDDVQSSNGGVK